MLKPVYYPKWKKILGRRIVKLFPQIPLDQILRFSQISISKNPELQKVCEDTDLGEPKKLHAPPRHGGQVCLPCLPAGL